MPTAKKSGFSSDVTPPERRAQWIKCLDSEDPNSIAHQVAELVHMAAVYDAINQWRKMAPREGDQLLLNPMLHHYIDRTFWTSQIAGVRKLVDKNPLTPRTGEDKSVYSLVSLIRGMKSYHTECHSDTVPEFVLDGLIWKLEVATGPIVTLANKHTFHAASETSRESDKDYEKGMVLTLKILREAREAICKTFRFVANDLLNQGEYDLLVERRIGDFRMFSLGHSIEDCEQLLIQGWLATAAQIKGYTSWTIDELIPAKSPNTESENVS
jgi:hypothetical protein